MRENWAERLRKLKEAGDFSWEALARELDASLKTIQNWVYGGIVPSSRMRRRIRELEERIIGGKNG